MVTITAGQGRRWVQGVRVLAVLLVAFAVGLTMSTLTRATGSEDDAQNTSNARFGWPGEEGNPFIDGERNTLAEAEEIVAYDLLRPKDALASDESLTSVWISIASDQVAFEYESGVWVTITQSQLADEVEARIRFERNAKHWQAKGVEMYVTTIDGAPTRVSIGNRPGYAPSTVMQIGQTTLGIQGRLSGISKRKSLGSPHRWMPTR